MNLKNVESYYGVNMLGPGPHFMKKGFTRPRFRKVWETPGYSLGTRIRKQKQRSRCFVSGTSDRHDST